MFDTRGLCRGSVQNLGHTRGFVRGESSTQVQLRHRCTYPSNTTASLLHRLAITRVCALGRLHVVQGLIKTMLSLRVRHTWRSTSSLAGRSSSGPGIASRDDGVRQKDFTKAVRNSRDVTFPCNPAVRVHNLASHDLGKPLHCSSSRIMFRLGQRTQSKPRLPRRR